MKLSVHFFAVLTFLFAGSSILSVQGTIRLLDYDGNVVDFFLIDQSEETILKANDGEIDLSLLQQHKGKRFRLHFNNHLAYLLYHTNWYYQNGNRLKDRHIRFDRITFEQLADDKDGIFYVRRKEIRLDDESGGNR